MARKLRHPLNEVDMALSQGQISFDHARALAESTNSRVIDELAAAQGDWIAKAADRPFALWRRELAREPQLLDQDGPYDPNRDLARNRLTIRGNGTDGIRFTGELHRPEALAFKQAIEAKANELFRAFTKDHNQTPDINVPHRNTLHALALVLVELLRLGVACDRRKVPGPAVDLTVVWSPDHRQILEDLSGELKLSYERFSVLFCDPFITPMTITINGEPLDVMRAERTATPAQRRALHRRDGGCVFPGCEAPAHWCDIHHVQHWEHDGDTDLATLAMLCRRHHGVTHRRGWSMAATDDQHFVWTTSRGETLHSQRHHGRPPPDT